MGKNLNRAVNRSCLSILGMRQMDNRQTCGRTNVQLI